MIIIDDYIKSRRIVEVEYDLKLFPKKHPGLAICYRLAKKNERVLKDITLTEVYDIGEYREPWKISFQEFKEKYNEEKKFIDDFSNYQLDEWIIILENKGYSISVVGDCDDTIVKCIFPKEKTIDIKEILEIED